MANILHRYFPNIRTREEILEEIQANGKLSGYFYAWTPERREEFLNFCSGKEGISVLYDSLCRKVLNPEKTPARLEDFLSALLKEEVHILYTLPKDSTDLTSENLSLLAEMIVRLSDGSTASVEIQKNAFSAQRSVCCSADALLRQYRRVFPPGEENAPDIVDTVYTIVLFEKSPAIFHEFPNCFVHSFKQKSDTGIEIELLQQYIFIPLDIFRARLQNNPMESRLEAWLTFLSERNPEKIAELIEAYPDFKFIYEDIYKMCQNMEEAMGLFAEELKILSRSTVQLMMDEMQNKLDRKAEELDRATSRLRITSAAFEKSKRLNLLLQKLAESGRAEEISRAAREEVFQQELLKQFQIG